MYPRGSQYSVAKGLGAVALVLFTHFLRTGVRRDLLLRKGGIQRFPRGRLQPAGPPPPRGSGHSALLGSARRRGRPRPLSCKTLWRGWAPAQEPALADWPPETHLFPDSPHHMDGCLLTCSKKYQELSRQRRECLQKGKSTLLPL